MIISCLAIYSDPGGPLLSSTILHINLPKLSASHLDNIDQQFQIVRCKVGKFVQFSLQENFYMKD